MLAIVPETGLGLPRNIALGGERIDTLLHDGFAWVGLLFTVLAGAMIIAAWRRRKRGDGVRGDGAPATRRTLGAALAIFGLIDGTIFVRAVRDVRSGFNDFEALDRRPDAVRVEIHARQWAWDVRYAGDDGQFNTADDVLTLNEVVVPVGAPVLIELAAGDVVHAFSVPNLRIKRDAVPGRINTLTFTATETGDYEIACQQHCGVNHYKMHGLLRVLSTEAYRAWSARRSDEGTRGFDPDDRPAHWGWPWTSRS
jgi:cytochrome c oxidase subunit 2